MSPSDEERRFADDDAVDRECAAGVAQEEAGRPEMDARTDKGSIRSKNGVQNIAALRKLALALLKRDTSMPKLSIARRRKRAARLDEYALASCQPLTNRLYGLLTGLIR